MRHHNATLLEFVLDNGHILSYNLCGKVTLSEYMNRRAVEPHKISLALMALTPDDQESIDRLVRGLHFKRPLTLDNAAPQNADIVLVDSDCSEGQCWLVGNHYCGNVVRLTAQESLVSSHHHLKKPLRAREFINCINDILDQLRSSN